MNRPHTAREALIAEALGDVARLLDRVEVLIPALDQSRQAAAQACSQLDARLAQLEAQMAAVTQTARTQVVQHIVQRTEEAAQRAQAMQSRAMAEAARELFRAELERSVNRLVATMELLRRQADRPWDLWLTHAATAAVASVLTLGVAAWLLPR